MITPYIYRCILVGTLLLSLTACYQQATMSHTVFEKIPPGTPICSVHAMVGAPYEVIPLPDGAQIHNYIERTEISPGVIDQTTYSIRVENGLVMYKKVKTESRGIDVQFSQ